MFGLLSSFYMQTGIGWVGWLHNLHVHRINSNLTMRKVVIYTRTILSLIYINEGNIYVNENYIASSKILERIKQF